MRKSTKIARRKKRQKALRKIKQYHNSDEYYKYWKAQEMYKATLKSQYPYTTSRY